MRDDIETAARALVDAVQAEQEWDTTLDPDNFGCACNGTPTTDPMDDLDKPCSSCRAKVTKSRAVALRAALAAPATVDAGAMREACAVEAKRVLGGSAGVTASLAIRALPLPAAPASGAVEEARERVFHTAGTAKVLRTVYEIGMEARMYRVDADRESALRSAQDAEEAMDYAVLDYSKALAAERAERGGKGA